MIQHVTENSYRCHLVLLHSCIFDSLKIQNTKIREIFQDEKFEVLTFNFAKTSAHKMVEIYKNVNPCLWFTFKILFNERI